MQNQCSWHLEYGWFCSEFCYIAEYWNSDWIKLLVGNVCAFLKHFDIRISIFFIKIEFSSRGSRLYRRSSPRVIITLAVRKIHPKIHVLMDLLSQGKKVSSPVTTNRDYRIVVLNKRAAVSHRVVRPPRRAFVRFNSEQGNTYLLSREIYVCKKSCPFKAPAVSASSTSL